MYRLDTETPRLAHNRAMCDEYLIVFTTVPDRDTGRAIAEILLDRKLAASVQISGPIESRYWWQDELCQAEEYVCACRTITTRYGEIEAEIRALHPYVTPEIIATPIASSSADCLAWISAYSRGVR